MNLPRIDMRLLVLLLGVVLLGISGTTGAQETTPSTPSPGEAALLGALRERAAELDERERALDLKEKEVRALMRETERRIDALQALARDVEAARAQLRDEEDREAAEMARAIAAMQPREAARLIGALDVDLAERISMRLPSIALGAILNYMDTTLAAELARRLAPRSSSDLSADAGNS